MRKYHALLEAHLSLQIHLYFAFTSSEGSDESAQMRLHCSMIQKVPKHIVLAHTRECQLFELMYLYLMLSAIVKLKKINLNLETSLTNFDPNHDVGNFEG